VGDPHLKSLTAGMIADLASDTQTFNTCWLITRTDATVYAFTDCDQPITIGGVTYSPTDGYTPSANTNKSDFSTDNMEVAGFLDSAAITEDDVAAGKWDFAQVRAFMVNRNAISHGTYEMRYGWLGQVKIIAPGKYTAELRGLAQAVQNTIGDLVTPTCRYKLGSVRCTVNLASYTVTGAVVTSVASTQQFIASGLTQAAGYFSFGTITWTSGNNAGVSMDIQGFGTGGVVLMQLPMSKPIAIADTFTIVAGCTKRFAQDCVAKFGNGVNFGGFPKIPGIDKMVRPAGV
jgi:uncharacterized phage protein (TIGR02218 family)